MWYCTDGILSNMNLLSTCCKDVSEDDQFKACGEPATHWYYHNDTKQTCSFCDKHDNVGGDCLVPIPCAGCQTTLLVRYDLVDEFIGMLYCEQCFDKDKEPYKT
jgi:hypothetical protein